MMEVLLRYRNVSSGKYVLMMGTLLCVGYRITFTFLMNVLIAAYTRDRYE